MAANFREKRGLEAEIYVDPGLALYDALGCVRSLRKTLVNGPALRKIKAALGSGYNQQGVQGSASQLGGFFLFSGGKIEFSSLESFGGDTLNCEQLTSILAPFLQK